MRKMTKTAEKFNKAEQFVAYCLREFPETRENDRTLMLKVWELQGFRFPKKLIKFFYEVYSPETIRRCRQSIQSEGLYRSNPLKTAQRSLYAMEHRDYWRTRQGDRQAGKGEYKQVGG